MDQAKDMFGQIFEPGDIFLYSGSNSTEMRVGVFIAYLPTTIRANKLDGGFIPSKVKFRLINPFEDYHPVSQLDTDFFILKSYLLPNSCFMIDNFLIQKAFKLIEELKSSGEIK